MLHFENLVKRHLIVIRHLDRKERKNGSISAVFLRLAMFLLE